MQNPEPLTSPDEGLRVGGRRVFGVRPCGHPRDIGTPVDDPCSYCYDYDEARLLHALQTVHGRAREREQRLADVSRD